MFDPLILAATLFVFWAALGIATLKQEMENKNAKLLNLPAHRKLAVFCKACFYGWFTGSGVVAKL